MGKISTTLVVLVGLALLFGGVVTSYIPKTLNLESTEPDSSQGFLYELEGTEDQATVQWIYRDGAEGQGQWQLHILITQYWSEVAFIQAFTDSFEPVAWSLRTDYEAISQFDYWVATDGPDFRASAPYILPANRQSEMQSWRVYTGIAPLPCGFLPGLLPAPSSQNVAWGDCEGDSEVPAKPAGRFQIDGLDGQILSTPESEIWLAPNMSLPMQVKPRGDSTWGAWVLRGTVPPMAALADIELQSVPAAPTVPAEPLEVWGAPRYGGPDLFSVEEAMDAAITHPYYDQIREFLAENPSAYLSAGAFSITWEDEDPYYSWALELSNGERQLLFSMSKQKVEPMDLGVDTGLLEETSPWRYVLGYLDSSKRITPPPASIDSNLPSVEMLTEALYGAGDTVQWAFGHDCNDAFCLAPASWVAVGSNQVQVQDAGPVHGAPARVPVLIGDVNHTADLLAFNEAGLPSFQWVVAEERTADLVPSHEPTLDRYAPPIEPAPDVLNATVVGIGVALIVLGLLGRGLMVSPLFSRLSQTAVETHPTRQLIMEVVQETPGIHYRNLQGQTGIPRGTLDHHLDALCNAGVLMRKTNLGYTCYFPYRMHGASALALTALKSPTAKALLDAVCRQPGASNETLAEAANVSPSTSLHHLRRMESVGLINRTRQGRYMRNYPTPVAFQVKHMSDVAG